MLSLKVAILHIVDSASAQGIVAARRFGGRVRVVRERTAADPAADWVCVSQEHILTRCVSFPTRDPATLAGLIRHEGREAFPFPGSAELCLAWSIIAEHDEASTVLLAAAKKETLLRQAAGNGGALPPHSVPAFAPLFHLFRTRFPLQDNRVYALVHHTPRQTFLVLCRGRQLLAVQNLPGFVWPVGQPPGGSGPANGISRPAQLLQRTLHALTHEQKLPVAEELVFSGFGEGAGPLAELIAQETELPARCWPELDITPHLFLAVGTAELAFSADRSCRFEFDATELPVARSRPAPLTALRFACHFMVVTLLFLSLQLTYKERGRELAVAAQRLDHDLITLLPALAGATALHEENLMLLAEVGTERQSLAPDFSAVLARLAELTPPDVAIRQLALGAEAGSIGGGDAAPRHIATPGIPATPAAGGGRGPLPVTISGRARDAVAFARYCRQLEEAQLFANIRCRNAELTGSGDFDFVVEGRL